MTSVTWSIMRTAQYANSTEMAQGITNTKSYYGNMDVSVQLHDSEYTEETSFVNQALFDLNPDSSSGDDGSSALTMVASLGAGIAILSAALF